MNSIRQSQRLRPWIVVIACAVLVAAVLWGRHWQVDSSTVYDSAESISTLRAIERDWMCGDWVLEGTQIMVALVIRQERFSLAIGGDLNSFVWASRDAGARRAGAALMLGPNDMNVSLSADPDSGCILILLSEAPNWLDEDRITVRRIADEPSERLSKMLQAARSALGS